jgi:hypothetical protein
VLLAQGATVFAVVALRNATPHSVAVTPHGASLFAVRQCAFATRVMGVSAASPANLSVGPHHTNVTNNIHPRHKSATCPATHLLPSARAPAVKVFDCTSTRRLMFSFLRGQRSGKRLLSREKIF